MMTTLAQREHWTLEDMALHFGPLEMHRPLSKESFVELTERYPNLRIERASNGNITLMSPVKKGSSRRENRLSFLLNIWNFHHSSGEVYGANGSYDLPNGATQMPDAFWISPERLANQPDDEEQYIQIVPDFVIEIRSHSDGLPKLQEKMTQTCGWPTESGWRGSLIPMRKKPTFTAKAQQHLK